MKRKMLESCPTCGGEFEISRITCTSCSTEVSSHYSPCRFCRLSPEDLAFFESFVKSRGNVKEMERELEISYWTIRSKINDLITKLGFETEPDAEEEGLREQRREILDRVDSGELDASTAAELLSKLK